MIHGLPRILDALQRLAVSAEAAVNILSASAESRFKQYIDPEDYLALMHTNVKLRAELEKVNAELIQCLAQIGRDAHE